MNLFLSKFKNKIDVKGRVSIPVSFRNILLKDVSQKMFCYPSLDAQAIDAGGQSLSKEIYALMDNLDPYSDERDYLSTALFGLSEELKIDFNVHDAFEEIKSKFRDDFDSACNFYLKGVTTDDNRQLAKKYIKEIALVDNELKDREVRFLVLCKQAWGRSAFD